MSHVPGETDPVVIGDRLQSLMMVIIICRTILTMRCVQYQTTFPVCPSIFTKFGFTKFRNKARHMKRELTEFLAVCHVELFSLTYQIKSIIILVSSFMPHPHVYIFLKASCPQKNIFQIKEH